MATSPVDICNIALKRLGAAAIVSFTEGTDRASLCSVLYDPVRQQILRELEWNFAQVRAALPQLTAVPVFGFGLYYQYPTLPLCLKINETDPPDTIYRIENNFDSSGKITGRVIITDESSFSVRYTADIIDVTQFDPSFIKALAAGLAVEMCQPLTENATLTKTLGEEFKVILSHAATVNGQESSTRQADISVLVDVRRHGFREPINRNQNVV